MRDWRVFWRWRLGRKDSAVDQHLVVVVEEQWSQCWAAAAAAAVVAAGSHLVEAVEALALALVDLDSLKRLVPCLQHEKSLRGALDP